MEFNKSQLHQMLECATYEDEVFVDLRKGLAQTRYIVQVSSRAEYFDLDKEEILPVDENLVGYWMQQYESDNSWDEYSDRLSDNNGWVKCKQVEVVTTKWEKL